MRIFLPDDMETALQRAAAHAGYRHTTTWLREKVLPPLLAQHQDAAPSDQKAAAVAPAD